MNQRTLTLNPRARRPLWLLLGCVLGLPLIATANWPAAAEKPVPFVPGDVIESQAFNDTFDDIYSYLVGYGSQLEDLEARVVPAGVIVAWSGAIVDIPPGWVLCDGENELTPDLRERFIVGAGSGYEVDAVGGEAMVTLSTEEIPNHDHSYNHAVGAEIPFCGVPCLGPPPFLVDDVVHQGAGTSSSGGGGAHENRPPYYALAYIMKL